MNQYHRFALAGLIGIVTPATATIVVADFEDVTLPTAYGGPGGGNYYNGSDFAGGFASNSINFPNTFTDFGGGFTGWTGFAVSSTIDTTTPGFGNQYSAFTGGAFSGSHYAVGFADSPQTINFGGSLDLSEAGGFYATNTTYAALSMQDGDSFAKQFGGPTGDDPDFFLLTIEGLVGGSATGSVEFYLADYRFADNSQDYIIDAWTWVDLTSLGEVEGLQFSLSSSDNGTFGMNTPAYFAMDNLTIPEPSALALALLGGVGLLRRRR